MIKTKTIFEIVKGERKFELVMDPTSTLGEIHDVLLEMRHYIVQRINDAEKADAPKQVEVETHPTETDQL